MIGIAQYHKSGALGTRRGSRAAFPICASTLAYRDWHTHSKLALFDARSADDSQSFSASSDACGDGCCTAQHSEYDMPSDIIIQEKMACPDRAASRMSSYVGASGSKFDAVASQATAVAKSSL